MNEQDLARAVAEDLGDDVLAAIDKPQPEDATRAFGIPEAMAVGGFIVQCAQLAVEIWSAERDHAVLVQALNNNDKLASIFPSVDPEKRLGLVARVVRKFLPDCFAPPHRNHAATSMADKQRWIADLSRRPKSPRGKPW